MDLVRGVAPLLDAVMPYLATVLAAGALSSLGAFTHAFVHSSSSSSSSGSNRILCRRLCRGSLANDLSSMPAAANRNKQYGKRGDQSRSRQSTVLGAAAAMQSSGSETRPIKTLLIDNYDSYTYNLYHQLAAVNGVEPHVVYNDAADSFQQLLVSSSRSAFLEHRACRTMVLTMCSL